MSTEPQKNHHRPYEGDHVPIPRWVVSVASRMFILGFAAILAIIVTVVMSVFALISNQTESRRIVEETDKKVSDIAEKVDTLDTSVKKAGKTLNKLANP